MCTLLHVYLFLCVCVICSWSTSTTADLKSVLVTGGVGFIGFHTGLKLASTGEETEVIVLDSFDNSYDVELKKTRASLLERAGVTVHEGDVCSRQMLDHLFSLHKFTHVIHLAGRHGTVESMSRPQDFLTVNAQCFLRLLETLKDHNSTRLVYASSNTVYGIQADSTPVSVNSNVGPPATFFAALKIGMEELVSAYCFKHGFKAIGLRMFSVYGPWDRPNSDLYAMATNIVKRKHVKLYRNTKSEKLVVAQRDYTYVTDVVSGILSAMDYTPPSTECNRIFNIGSGQPVSMKTVFNLLKKEFKMKAKVRYVQLPKWESLVTNADIQYTKQQLQGYDPAIDIDEGIRKFVKWYEDYHKHKKFTWKYSEPNSELSNNLYKNRIKYVNEKYHNRLIEMRLKYESYAESNNLPVTNLHISKKFYRISRKTPTATVFRTMKNKRVKELMEYCQDVEECLAFTSEGKMFSYVGLIEKWKSFSGETYLADVDICKAGLTSCYGNCTCTYKGPSQGKIGCAEGFGLLYTSNKYYCIELYSPKRPTAKEEEFMIADTLEERDWKFLINNVSYFHYSKSAPPIGSGTIAYYPEAAGDVQRLQAACNNTYRCLGFVTNGELKGSINSKWKEGSSKNDFYVRDFNYCEFSPLDCKCDRLEPGRYVCPHDLKKHRY